MRRLPQKSRLFLPPLPLVLPEKEINKGLTATYNPRTPQVEEPRKEKSNAVTQPIPPEYRAPKSNKLKGSGYLRSISRRNGRT